jgi:hypothetical protein
MPTTYKILGQSAPSAAATASTTLVTAANPTIISSIRIVNRDTVATTFDIAVVPSGGTLGNQHYISFDTQLGAKEDVGLVFGITLATGDTLRVGAANGLCSFSAFGSEIS